MPWFTPSFLAFESLTRMFSPSQFNPLNINPLRDALAACVDFAELKRWDSSKLFLSATNIRTGNVRVFQNQDLSSEALLASACLPSLFQAIEIEGSYYRDGGYMGKPSLFPLFYRTDSRDVVVGQTHRGRLDQERVPRATAPHADSLDTRRRGFE